VKGIEIRNAVDAQDHSLAVEHEALLADHPGGFHDPRISARPVIAVAGEQADANRRHALLGGDSRRTSLREAQSGPLGTAVAFVGHYSNNVLRMARR
jgi:hypothetical protein